jgi:tetratricopeptide (TPR) repeat protein
MDIGSAAIGWGATELSGMIKKRLENRKQNKEIAKVFHDAFSRCDERVLVLCNQRAEFREQIFSLAEGVIIRGKTLLEEAEAHAGGGENSPFMPSALCDSLEEFSRELCNIYREKMSQKYGDLPAGYACLYNELVVRCTALSAGPPKQQDEPPRGKPFYLPHRLNPLLRHFRTWMEKIGEALAASSQAAISQPEHFRDLALYGLGGIGKTAMAVAYAYSHAERYPGGVFWLQADLGLSQALAEMAKGLGWDLPDDLNDQQITKEVLDRLQTPELKLVILDNQDEHVVPQEISQIPASHLLVTTRLSDVNVGAQVSMALPAEEEALGIFLAYAGKEDADLSQAQAQAAYAICRRVGFLPLALEILGKNARSQSLLDLAQALDQAVTKKATVLTKKKELGPEKQELSIAAALAVTGHQYSHPRAKEALLHLAYLHSEELGKDILALIMDVEEAEAQEMLASLAQFSVVQPGAEGGYSMHRLVQEAARLEDEGSEVGERVVEVLDEEIKAVDEKGEYKAGYWLIPHLLLIADMSRQDAGEEEFPRNDAIYNWAKLLWNAGRHQASDDMYAKAQVRVGATKGELHEDYAVILNNRAVQMEAQGKLPEAEKLYRQAMEITGRTVGKDHPSYAIRLNNLAGVLQAQGKFPQAEKLYRQAMEIGEKTIGKQHPNYAIRLNNLAGVLRAQGRLGEALEPLQQAVAICQKALGPEHPQTINIQKGLDIVRSEGKDGSIGRLRRGGVCPRPSSPAVACLGGRG